MAIMVATSLYAQPPKWFVNQEALSRPEYITGTGTGKTYHQAYQNAIYQLASQVETKVQASYERLETTDQAVYKKSKLISSVNESLPLMKTIKQEQSEGQYFIAVAIKKQVLEKVMRSKKRKVLQQIDQVIEKSKSYQKQGKISQAVLVLNEIKGMNKKVQKYNQILIVISTSIDSPAPLTHIEQKKIELENQIQLIKIKPTGKIQAESDLKVIQYQLLINKMPAIGEKVTVTHHNHIDQKITDQNGLITIYPEIQDDQGLIKVVFQCEKIKKVKKISYQLTIENDPKTISVSINQDGLKLPWVEAQLKKQFIEMGYRIKSTRPDISCEGNLDVVKTKKLMGVLGEKYLVDLQINLKIQDKKKKEQYLSLKGKSIEETIQKATQQAIKNIKISPIKFKKRLKKLSVSTE